MQDMPRKEVTDRLHVSFGFMSTLAQLLDAIDFLTLQRLNRYAYNVSVSRAQSRWWLPRCQYALSFIEDELDTRELFALEINRKESKWTKLEDAEFEMSRME